MHIIFDYSVNKYNLYAYDIVRSHYTVADFRGEGPGDPFFFGECFSFALLIYTLYTIKMPNSFQNIF